MGLIDNLRSKMSGTTSNGTHKKVLVVFGATGKQGGSVVKSVLGDPKTAALFSVRAITRDPSKPSAQELTKVGCECVSVSVARHNRVCEKLTDAVTQADVDDKASLRTALDGAYAVYAVTNFWEKKSAAAEVQQGKNIADVAKECGVQHLIWSSLLNITKRK